MIYNGKSRHMRKHELERRQAVDAFFDGLVATDLQYEELSRQINTLNSTVADSSFERTVAIQNIVNLRGMGRIAIAPTNSNGHRQINWWDVTLEFPADFKPSSNGHKPSKVKSPVELPPVPIDITRPDILAPGFWNFFEKPGVQFGEPLNGNLPALGIVKGSWPGESYVNPAFASYYDHCLDQRGLEKDTLPTDRQRAEMIRRVLRHLQLWNRTDIHLPEAQVAED